MLLSTSPTRGTPSSLPAQQRHLAAGLTPRSTQQHPQPAANTMFSAGCQAGAHGPRHCSHGGSAGSWPPHLVEWSPWASWSRWVRAAACTFPIRKCLSLQVGLVSLKFCVLAVERKIRRTSFPKKVAVLVSHHQQKMQCWCPVWVKRLKTARAPVW